MIRFASTPTDELREIESSFAFEYAAGLIESNCVAERTDSRESDPFDSGWLNLRTSDVDVTDAVAYLQARGCLRTHPVHADWVMICGIPEREDFDTRPTVH